MTKFHRFILTFIFLLAFSACGQKTPLKIEKPQKTQEDVTEQTI